MLFLLLLLLLLLLFPGFPEFLPVAKHVRERVQVFKAAFSNFPVYGPTVREYSMPRSDEEHFCPVQQLVDGYSLGRAELGTFFNYLPEYFGIGQVFLFEGLYVLEFIIIIIYIIIIIIIVIVGILIYLLHLYIFDFILPLLLLFMYVNFS